MRDSVIGEIKGRIGIGEAKTGEDLDERAKQQFLEFSNQKMDTGEIIPFFIAIPKSYKVELCQVLLEIGLIDADNIFIIEVENALLPED